MVDTPEPRGEVVGPKAAAEQLLNSGDLARIPVEDQEHTGDESAESWEELLAQVLTVWNSMAKTRLPVWVFTPMEVRALAGAWAPVAEKYAGPSLSVEAAAVLVTASVVLPRAAVTYKRKSKQRRGSHAEEKEYQEEKGQNQEEYVQDVGVEVTHGPNGDQFPDDSQEPYQDELPKE